MKMKIRNHNKDLLSILLRMDEGYTPTAEEERKLMEITEIDFSSLSLTALPKCLCMLVSLRSLDISDNNLKELPEDLGKLSALQFLDISDNRLLFLPECLGRLSALRSLNARDNELELLPEWLGQLSALRSLDVSGNQINTLPECFEKLSALQTLDISDNLLDFLPDSLGQLSALQSLDVSDNLLYSLPECLERLSALKTLDVSSNRLQDLPDYWGKLPALESFNVRDNQLEELPESIGQLTALETFNVTNNMLDTVPESLGYLTRLYKLGLGNNRLTKLPDTFANLCGLRDLYIWRNPITVFPPQIFKLSSLQLLDISTTFIQDIPPHISKLKGLKLLNLNGLRLHKIPPEIMALNLPFIFETPKSNDVAGIYLKNVSLSTQPVSLFMHPSQLIQTYFDMEQIPINEGKVIFLGHGDVGKSYSIQRLLNHDEQGDFKTSMTPGISISHLSVEEDGRQFNICFWDFGGQEIMHAMHRCFLTHRTCYVVVVSNRLPDLDGQARYWLRNVESFASGSDVLLVINRWEDYPSNKDLNYNQLKTDFKNLVGCVSVSAKCDDKQTFHRLTKQIIQMASKLDSTGMDFPIQWYSIRQELTKMAENGKYYINQDDYYQICVKNGLTDANIRMWLLEWFNDLGTCFSYHQDTDKKELKEYKVLNPEWLTNAIYIVILNGKKFTQNGIIPRKGIEYLLSNPSGGTLSGVTYTPEECGYILEVMRKFTLSYSASETEEFIPALCPNETPKNLYPAKHTDHLSYEIEYTYLPDSVIHQLMIYCYQYLTLDKCWRRGMSIEITGMGLSAVVSMGGSDRLMSIDVYSCGKTPLWVLLQPLLEAIRKINTNLNLNAVDYVFAETVVEEEIFRDRYELNYILSVKKGNSRRRPSDLLQGKEVDHSIPDLLAKLYGKENLLAAESETQGQNEIELTPDILAGATLNNCTIVFGNHSSMEVYQHQEMSEQVLRTILEHQALTTEKFLEELSLIFSEQRNDEMKELGEAMQSAHQQQISPFEVLRERLDDTDKMASIAANLYSAWPAIKAAVKKLPELAALLGDFMSKGSAFFS